MTTPSVPRERARPSVGASVAVGVGAGVMSGVFGIGGGVVLVPALTAVLGMSQHRAHATSLAAIVLTALAGVVGFAVRGSVDLEASAFVAVGAVAGALVGARFMAGVSPRRLQIAFGVLLLIVAVQMLIGATPEPGAGTPPAAALWYLLVGLGAGLLSAVMGVGGGVVLVPALVLLFGFNQQLAEGTSLAIIVPTAIAGSVQHGRSGLTDWRTGAIVGAGGIVGALVGSQLAHVLDAAVLQRLFAVLLLGTGIQLAVTAARAGSSPSSDAAAP